MESNIFKILGIETKENYHSRFIVEILKRDIDARESFIKRLYEVTGKRCKFLNDHSEYKFDTEKRLSDGSRVDIFLSNHSIGGNNRIIIENKINAGDQPQQLYRYFNEYSERYYNGSNEKYNIALFYLTLDAKDATNYSKMKGKDCLEKNKDYFLLSYKDQILPWLLELVENNHTSLERCYVMDYIKIVQELTQNWVNLSTMIKKVFDKNEDIFKTSSKKITLDDFNAFLELKFWEYLEGQLLNKDIEEVSGIINRRLFNYEKIQNAQKTNYKQRRYGIIFYLSNPEDQLSVLVNKERDLSISFGRINEMNEWVPTLDIEQAKFSTNEFKKEENMIIIANEIVKVIKTQLTRAL